MPASRSDQTITFQLPRNALKIAGLAFCGGLLLFVVVWLNARRHNDAYPVDPAQPVRVAGDPQWKNAETRMRDGDWKTDPGAVD